MKSTGLLILVLCCLIPLGFGCAQTRTYEVDVRNDTHGPVTIWLFKDGGPDEDGWKSPEDIAIESPNANEPLGGRAIRPGAIATAGPIKGRFDSDSNAVLRVYRGVHTFNELLAISHEGPERTQVKITEGYNAFLITDEDKRMALFRVRDIPATQP